MGLHDANLDHNFADMHWVKKGTVADHFDETEILVGLLIGD